MMNRKAQRILMGIWIGALLLLTFANLGANMLANDEYVSFEHSVAILDHGFPINEQGCIDTTLIAPEQEARFAEYSATPLGCLWTYNTWMREYVIAGSVALFGATPFAARFPFALAGLLAVWVFYLLARRLISSWWLQFAALIAFSLHPQFLLFSRFSAYYSITLLFTLASVYAYLRYREDRRWLTIYWLFSFLLLCSHIPTFVVTSASLFGAHAVCTRIWNSPRAFIRSLFPHVIDVVMLAIWSLIIPSHHSDLFHFHLINLPLAILYITTVFIPLYFFIFFLMRDGGEMRFLKWVFFFWILFIALMPFKEIIQVRYLFPIIPLAVIYLVAKSQQMKAVWRIIVVAALVLGVITNVFLVAPFLPAKAPLCQVATTAGGSCRFFDVRAWGWEYLHEIARPSAHLYDNQLAVVRSMPGETVTDSACIAHPCLIAHEQFFSGKRFIYHDPTMSADIIVDQRCTLALDRPVFKMHSDLYLWSMSPSIINHNFYMGSNSAQDVVCIWHR